jgi:hypothetical protein
MEVEQIKLKRKRDYEIPLLDIPNKKVKSGEESEQACNIQFRGSRIRTRSSTHSPRSIQSDFFDEKENQVPNDISEGGEKIREKIDLEDAINAEGEYEELFGKDSALDNFESEAKNSPRTWAESAMVCCYPTLYLCLLFGRRRKATGRRKFWIVQQGLGRICKRGQFIRFRLAKRKGSCCLRKRMKFST